MLRHVRCECGYLARGGATMTSSAPLAHIATDHPDLAETERADDIRTVIELVPD